MMMNMKEISKNKITTCSLAHLLTCPYLPILAHTCPYLLVAGSLPMSALVAIQPSSQLSTRPQQPTASQPPLAPAASAAQTVSQKDSTSSALSTSQSSSAAIIAASIAASTAAP